MNSYFFQSALLPNGWQRKVRVTIADGVFQTLELNADQQTNDVVLTDVIPAMPNAHSHVFQRAMAGLSEYRRSGEDSFWSWRDLMYRLADQMDTETLYEVAKTCYAEMKAAGYAAVCEFHYVHRSKDKPADYFSHAETILKAAHEVGLSITFLPVLYAFSGVGEQPLQSEQKRFELSVDEYIQLYQHLEQQLKAHQRLGVCFHSIRAVNQQQMQQLIDALPKAAPIHIHIAEQQAEVDQALQHYGQRPVAWLCEHFDVNPRWSLVHATHLDATENKLISDSGAVAVLCPLTEANLGDGIFPMPAFKAHQGVWAIGSDSHVEIKPQAELKMLEYSQRLGQQQRNICCDDEQPHVGTWLWLQAVKGGNQACGATVAGIQPGAPARLIELQHHDGHKQAEWLLDDWLFSDRTAAQVKWL